MEAIHWVLAGIVAVGAVIASFLAIILVIRNTPAAATTPAGGTVAPPAWKKVTDSLQSVFSVQAFIVMAVFAAFEFTLWKTNWFPHLFEGVGLWHIPYYGTLIYLTNLVSEKTTGDRKTALMRTMFVIFAISGISHLVSKESIDKFVARWNAPPATETTRAPAAPLERRVARVPTDPCDNVYRTYRLSNRPKPMLRVSGCTVGWMVEEGGVILTDEDGNKQPPVRKDEDRGYGPPAKTWQAEGDYAVVRARFYRS